MARQLRHGAIDGVLGETRRLGLVGDGEAGGEAGLERELAQQRVAERVDGADGDVADAIAQRQPARAPRVALGGGAAQLRDDALAHLGGGLAGEGDGQDVRGIDADAQQVDVALHQHRRLAGAGRGLEHDVVARIDGVGARRLVGRERARRCRDRVGARRPGSSSKSNSPGCGLFVTDVVLAAHRREAAEVAGEQIVGGDRERAGLDRVGDRDAPRRRPPPGPRPASRA